MRCVKHIEEDKVNQPIWGFLGKANRLKKKCSLKSELRIWGSKGIISDKVRPGLTEKTNVG